MAVLIVEDDSFYATRLAELVGDSGMETILARTVEEALRIPSDDYDSAIIDVMLPNDPSESGISVEATRGGFFAGVAVARKIRKERPKVKLALITSDVWNSEIDEWAKAQNIPLLRKHEPQRIVTDALQSAGIMKGKLPPRAFIVHGHDEVALLQLKNYLQNVLRWREPIVLREQSNCGKTLIEKFEDFSTRVDCVFVLLTPDDQISRKSANETRRSRQNVIFELGFFYGQFGRQSGRVIVLYKGPNELPSDIQGVAWISIDGGVEAAGEQIRREVDRFTTGGLPGDAS
jgi:predicted nucleotide-binding protein